MADRAVEDLLEGLFRFERRRQDQDSLMNPTGLEHPAKQAENLRFSATRGTDSGTRRAELPSDLAEVAAAWGTLPAKVRAKITAIIRQEGQSR